MCLFCFQPLRCQWCGGFPTERCLHVWLVSSLSVWWLAGTIVDSAVVSFVTNAPSFSLTPLPVSFLLKCLERKSSFASSTLTICNMKGGKASSCVKFKKQNCWKSSGPGSYLTCLYVTFVKKLVNQFRSSWLALVFPREADQPSFCFWGGGVPEAQQQQHQHQLSRQLWGGAAHAAV